MRRQSTMQLGPVSRWCLHDLQLAKCLPSYLSKYEQVADAPGEDGLVHGMNKMSRLATDLANERTLLAWIRTVLAVVRTAFATSAWMPGVGLVWVVVHRLSVGLVLLLLLLSTLVGVYRYYKVASIIKRTDIPTYFGRLPMWPVNVTLVVCVLTVVAAMAVQGMEGTVGLAESVD